MSSDDRFCGWFLLCKMTWTPPSNKPASSSYLTVLESIGFQLHRLWWIPSYCSRYFVSYDSEGKWVAATFYWSSSATLKKLDFDYASSGTCCPLLEILHQLNVPSSDCCCPVANSDCVSCRFRCYTSCSRWCSWSDIGLNLIDIWISLI